MEADHTKRLGCIVVAGGKGVRMGAPLPKQYIEIAGTPILMHTLKALKGYNSNMPIVLVVPKDDIEQVRAMIQLHIGNEEALQIVAGGATRTDSVAAGLAALPQTVTHIAVHDGVRPYIQTDLLERLMKAEGASVIPTLPCSDSLRQLSDGQLIPFDRSTIRRVQTPQCFAAEVLRQAYTLASKVETLFTDDASLVEELLGIAPISVEGDERNIKITTPIDLALMELLLK